MSVDGWRYQLPSGHPQTDGQTERTNSTLAQYLRIFCTYCTTEEEVGQQIHWTLLRHLSHVCLRDPPALFAENPPRISRVTTQAAVFHPLYHFCVIKVPMKDLNCSDAAIGTSWLRVRVFFAERAREENTSRSEDSDLLVSLINAHKPNGHATVWVDAAVDKIDAAGDGKVRNWNLKIQNSTPGFVADYIALKNSIDAATQTAPTGSSRRHVGKTFPKDGIPPLGAGNWSTSGSAIHALKDCQAPTRYGKTQYLVSWKGYGPEENLWLPEDNLSNSPDLVADFKARTARVTTSKRKRKN
ncbi:retrotransposable element protein [Planoprotostelium fungivorum]|uniref:Retrotransposable element protein n=1 Tax=Planoprotostelium fungivorum TaxID=1890364 RepID=A0A2P6N2R9_9EUKA|nr:retrotransposable element protein [Planoprotostelium fungivorum]